MKTLDICKALYRRYEETEPIENYYGLLAVWALAQTAWQSGEAELLNKLVAYLEQYPKAGQTQHFNFDCYRCGGNARAYLAWKGLFPGQEEILDSYAQRMMNAPRSQEGILCMPTDPLRKKVWIDVVTCVTPFMLYVGKLNRKEEYCRFGISQCFGMFDLLLDPRTGLLHQCRGFMEDLDRISEDHWSRGNGWGIVGLAAILDTMPSGSEAYREAADRLKALTDSLLSYQTKRGVWRQEITERLAYEEASGTALILYGIGVGIRTGVLKDAGIRSAYEKGIRGMCNRFIGSGFVTEYSCPGCLCPGEGTEKGTVQAYITEKIPYPDEHHSFGCLMLALAEANYNGITELEWRGYVPRD